MKYLFLLAIQLSSLFIYAQGRIEGKINDKQGAALIGANLVIINSDNGTTSDAQGKFALEVDVPFPLA